MASKPSLKLQGVVKKIESPLAKYNSSGQLTCVVCNMVIKSEMVWTAHVNGRQHREKVASLKNNKPEPVFTKPQNVPMKRKAEPSSTNTPPSASPSKKGVPADFFDNHPPASTASSGSFPIKSILKNSSKTQYVNINEIVKSKPAPSTTEDMDTNEVPEAQPQVAVSHHPVAVSNQPDVIPEGFFDDPKMDAKVRHIEYKDPVEEEWNKFQKEIMDEVTASVAIQEEDQEEATAERQLEEIEEQMQKWGRVLELEQKKEVYSQRVRALREAKMEDSESSSSEDENVEMELFNWRSKAT